MIYAMKPKLKPEEVELIPPEAFEREAAILFRVPPAEVAEAESKRVRRSPGKRKAKKAS